MDIENYPVPDHPELQRRRDVTDIQATLTKKKVPGWAAQYRSSSATPGRHSLQRFERTSCSLRPALPGCARQRVSAMYSP